MLNIVMAINHNTRYHFDVQIRIHTESQFRKYNLYEVNLLFQERCINNLFNKVMTYGHIIGL